MKKIVSLVTALSIVAMFLTGIPISVSAADDSIEINETNFPDENFRYYIRTQLDEDRNELLSAEEIANITELNVTHQGISDLKGIEFFTALTTFKCSENAITEIDLSKNTLLTKLDCSSCSKLTKLNLSKNIALKELDCNISNLSTLDISQNTELTTLICSSNKLTSLDVSNNVKLTNLNCHINQLSSLDVSNNTALTELVCGSNQIAEIDISNNTALTRFSCSYNQFTELDIHNNTALESFSCNNNQLTSIDISSNILLTDFNCANNQLTDLDLSKNIKLERLHCYYNQLTELDVSNNTALYRLHFMGNNITQLDISNNKELQELLCPKNQLTSLDLSHQNAPLKQFNWKNNTYTVSTCVLDPADLPGEFDISKASDWTNATITDDNKIFSLEAGDATYTYDCGKDQIVEFTIVFPSRNLVKVEEKAADCTEDGNIEYYECSDCGYKFSTENPTASDILSDDDVRIAANGHTFAEEWSKDETDHWHAATCGHDVISEEAAHTWNDGVVTAEPTEEAEGEKTYTCMVCSAVKTESIDKLVHTHTYSDDWTSDETNHWHAATCGHDVISDKSAHTWNDGVVTTEPTEEAEGEKTYTCTVCSAVKTESIDKLEHTHTYSDDWTSDETNHWHAATCGHDVISDKSAHTWNDGVVTTEPTEEAEGEKTYTCTVCSATKTESIDQLEHTHTYSNAWTSDETNHWHAATCGHDVISDKSAHTWNDGVVTTEPTEDTEGEKTYICTVCGKTKIGTIPPLNHVHTLTHHKMVDADCLHTGTVEYWDCSSCGNKYSDEAATNQLADITIPAKGHTEVADAAVAATCTTDGKTEGKHCSVCNMVLLAQATVPKTGHTWDNGVVTKEPTSTAEGVKTFTCTVCGETKTEKIPATGGTGTPDTPSDNGSITTEVKPGNNAPTTEVKTPKEELIDAVLTPEEKEQTDNGVDIKIILKVEDGTNTAPAEDKAKVEREISRLTNYRLGQYLDVELLKIIGGNQENITQTKSEITVTFEIPANLLGKQNYSVIRVHEGETTVLADLDNDPNTITIKTDRFSTYALAYREKSGGNTGGDRPRPPVESEPTESDTSTPNESEPTESDTSTPSESEPTESDTSTSSESEPTTSETDTPSESGNGSSDSETTQPNDESFSSDVSDTVPSESAPIDNGENPATGIAVSCLPLAAAATVLTIVAKRKKK